MRTLNCSCSCSPAIKHVQLFPFPLCISVCVCVCVCGWRAGICVSGPPYILPESVCNFTFSDCSDCCCFIWHDFRMSFEFFLPPNFSSFAWFSFFFSAFCYGSLFMYEWIHSCDRNNRETLFQVHSFWFEALSSKWFLQMLKFFIGLNKFFFPLFDWQLQRTAPIIVTTAMRIS